MEVARCRMFGGRVEMSTRSLTLLAILTLSLACAPRKVTSQQTSPPITAQQSTTATSTAAPSPTPPPCPAPDRLRDSDPTDASGEMLSLPLPRGEDVRPAAVRSGGDDPGPGNVPGYAAQGPGGRRSPAHLPGADKRGGGRRRSPALRGRPPVSSPLSGCRGCPGPPSGRGS